MHAWIEKAGAGVIAAAAAMSMAAAGQAAAAGFSYSYSNPYDGTADDYIVSTSNVKLYTEGTVRTWVPTSGGADFASTTPGEIVYKFDFGSETVETASLYTRNPSFHWRYSRGHNFFFGSRNGADWVELVNAPPPAFAGANSGVFNGALPSSLLGGSQIWFKAQLYTYGPSVNACGACTNTAQHSRWDVNESSSAKSFSLDVTYADATPSAPAPLPASIALMGGALAVFGLMRRR